MREVHIKTATSGRDLGLGTAVGRSRVAHFLNRRFLSVGGRVRRIRILVKANKRACMLFNTGCSPSISYGKEGYGIPPSLMTTYRAIASASIGGGSGKCATTMIACRLGPDKDPQLLTIKDQVKMWLYLADQENDLVRLARAWSDARLAYP